jgi:hypothetical protein
MVELTSSYLGLRVSCPVIASAGPTTGRIAGPTTGRIEGLLELEAGGAAGREA